MQPKILSFGEIIWDIYPTKRVIGGAPLNFAAHVVIGGVDSSLISAVGDDSLGREAMEQLKRFGVGTEWVRVNACPTGQCIVHLDEKGVPSYHIVPDVAYDYICMSEEDLKAICREQYDALYFGTLIQRNQSSRKALRNLVRDCRFPQIVCDVNLRPDCYDRESIAFCMEHATILKISMEEEPILRTVCAYLPKNNTPRGIAQALLKANPNLEIVLLTMGKEGSYAYVAKTGEDYFQSSVGDKVVSTVGAGDSFLAAWLISYLRGKPVADCLQMAAEVSGFVVAHTEAVPNWA